MTIEYKQTPIGRVPKEWRIVKLKDIGEIVNGFGFPIKYQGKKNAKYVFVKVSDTNLTGNEKYISHTENTIDDDLVNKMRVRIYPPGTIIFPKIGMVIYLRKVRIMSKPGTFDNNIMGIIPKSDIVNTEFLYYYFLDRIDLTRLCGRTTAPSIRKSEVEKLKIALPPLPEQQRIAEVLSGVDDAIRRVDLAIAKTERLKKGLMQKLLTEGIGHKEFKETKIGKIPKTWKVVKLKEIASKIKDIDHKMPKKLVYGIPFVSIKYMLKFPDYNFKIDSEDSDLEFIGQEDYEHHKKRFDAKKGDIIYSRFGSIGNAKLINTDEPFIASYSIVLIKPHRNKVKPLFLVYALNSGKVRIQARIATKGATNRNLHLEDIQNLKIPFPPIKEQQKIAEILSTVDKKLELERSRKARLKRIKKGLMGDLLTGRRRVKVAM